MPSSIDHSAKRGRVWLLAGLLLGLTALAGCSTAPGGSDGDIPWNVPQPWEGVPAIPSPQ